MYTQLVKHGVCGLYSLFQVLYSLPERAICQRTFVDQEHIKNHETRLCSCIGTHKNKQMDQDAPLLAIIPLIVGQGVSALLERTNAWHHRQSPEARQKMWRLGNTVMPPLFQCRQGPINLKWIQGKPVPHYGWIGEVTNVHNLETTSRKHTHTHILNSSCILPALST